MEENNTSDDLSMSAVPTDTATEPTATASDAAAPSASSAVTNVVFVGSLAWATTDESLRAHFENAGLQIGEDEVVKTEFKEYTRRAVTVARYPDTKKSRGYGFVTLATPAEAQKAVDTLNDTELDGRNIRVQLKDMTPREDRPRRTFGGDSRGGDRRGGNDRFGGGDRRGGNGGNFNRRDSYESNNDSWAA